MSKTYATTALELSNFTVPAQTNTYKPVPHGQLIELTREAFDKAGFTITREDYDQTLNGGEANGRYTAVSNDKEMGIMFAWQNSYNKSITLKAALGSHVFICKNGMLVGDMGTFKRKHNGDVQTFTPNWIGEYVKSAGDTFYMAQQSRDRMKQVEINPRVRAELIGRMFIEEKVITANQLGILAKEIESPTHDYNAKDSLWELYNYTTFALKEAAPYKWMEQHTKAHNFLTSVIS